MGRSKGTPQKHNNNYCGDYIPVIKKRKKRNRNDRLENFFKITTPGINSQKYYLGKLLLGATNNLFPKEYSSVKISYVCDPNSNNEENWDEARNDNIIVKCDDILVLIKCQIDVQFIKELVSCKAFVFDFESNNDDVYIKVYFLNLPLPKFYAKIGTTTKTLFSLFYKLPTFDNDDSIPNKQRGSEIAELYKKLSKLKTLNKNVCLDKNKLQLLRPTLRPYQEKSVQWMLHRENLDESISDQLHPLYSKVTLESGLEIYCDKFTGYITTEKPLVRSCTKGGILADEMGLGKTVEVLACILLNPKFGAEQKIIESDVDSDEDEELSKLKVKGMGKKKNYIPDSSEESDSELVYNYNTRKRKKIKISDEKSEEPKTKVPEAWVKSSSKKSANKVALETWYQSVLADMSTVKSGSVQDDNAISVECICGSISEIDAIQCSKCPKYQHRKCFKYTESFGEYICPQCWLKEPVFETKATLIVTPISLKTQWVKEIRKHISGKVSIFTYDGFNHKPIYPIHLKEFDVVLTTYSVLQNELRLTEPGQIPSLRKGRKYNLPCCPLTTVKWWRLCLDEAQTVESPTQMVSEMARKIDAVHRWAVTGTPISKNISELHGLINYLQIKPYDDLITWNKILYEPYLNGDENPLINFLSKVLWRTAKDDVLDQINIPKQTYVEHKLEFTAVEKYFYKREHELSTNDFLSRVRKFDLSLTLDSLDKSTLKKLLAPLLTLRLSCSSPNTAKGRYLATRKQVTSMKGLLDALILKNKNDSEDCLRLIISALNGMAGIHLILLNPQKAVDSYREVLQLSSRYSEELDIDKPQLIHTLHNLAEVLDSYTPEQPTLRDEYLRRDCEELEKKYLEKFINESINAFDTFNGIMMNIEKMFNSMVLKDGQWYSDGINWISVNGYFKEVHTKLDTACTNESVNNTIQNCSERIMLQLISRWEDELLDLRARLFESVENIYDYSIDGDVHKILVKKDLVTKAMNCHLRPDKKAKLTAKCDVCLANDHLKKYEAKLFGMTKRKQTFEFMSLEGSWKHTLEELVFKCILSVLKSKNSKAEFIKDGEIHVTILENLKKEFKELRRLWTVLYQQISAKDELDICKIRLQLKTDDEEEKINKALKNLNYNVESKTESINLLSIHELDYQMSLLENDVKLQSAKLEKHLGTQSYLETLRKQQYEGQNPDPCPICKNNLEQHWSILLCGHSYCLDCIQILLEQNASNYIQCSICRSKQLCQEISYIKAGNTVTESDTTTIKGNYSTKIDAVIKLIVELKNKNPKVKILLFSSWMTVLNSLKKALIENSITCELAQSGTLNSKITKFKSETKNIMVFLLPINLGSKGLNLIEATHVILTEPLLNPADELQAIGRISRIGQTKPTFVHKLFIKNTIEENIHQAIMSNVDQWEKSRVTLQHLVDLFKNEKLIEEIESVAVDNIEVAAEESLDVVDAASSEEM